MTTDDLFKTLVPAGSALLGGLLVALTNHFFTRRRTGAETTKLEAEAEKTRVETEKLRVELSTIASSVQEVNTKLGHAREIVIYDGVAECDGGDFSTLGARFTGESPDKPKGTGLLKVENGILNVQRTNTAGRFRVTLLRYIYGGAERDYLPRNELIAGNRVLKLTCDVKVAGGAHTANFIIKNKAGGEWLANQEQTFAANEWTPVEAYFRIPASADCFLVFDDQHIARPDTSLQLRRLSLVERQT